MEEKGQYVHHNADEHDRHGSVGGFAVLARVFQHFFEHGCYLLIWLVIANFSAKEKPSAEGYFST